MGACRHGYDKQTTRRFDARYNSSQPASQLHAWCSWQPLQQLPSNPRWTGVSVSVWIFRTNTCQSQGLVNKSKYSMCLSKPTCEHFNMWRAKVVQTSCRYVPICYQAAQICPCTQIAESYCVHVDVSLGSTSNAPAPTYNAFGVYSIASSSFARIDG